ncbi:MAG: hypothetical protein ACOYYU_00270 [Chloroflexota bacterium]
MNKTLRFTSNVLSRFTVILVICFLLCATFTQAVQADAAPPPNPDVGGVAPYQPIETKVQMMSETVLIDVLPNPTHWINKLHGYWFEVQNQIRVSASFTMQNQGETEEKMQVIFPLTRLDYPWLISSYDIDPSSFVVKVDGRSVPTIEITTPPELQAIPDDWHSVIPPDGIFWPDVRWAAFDVTFPAHKDVLLQVEYNMNGGDQSLRYVDYILETGSGWYGQILSADIVVRLPYPATNESVPEASSGHEFSGNEVRWKMRNFEPKRKNNIRVSFIDTNLWVPTLEQRSRVGQHPNDAEAWYKLGADYDKLGFWRAAGTTSVHNQHLVDLSIEAFEKAIELRPNWGDAHYYLARVLWYNNVKNNYTPQNNLTVKDPVVQRILQELNLAASYGVTDNSYDYFVTHTYEKIPDLELSPSIAVELTATPIIPTSTPAPIFGTTERAVTLAAGYDHTCVLTLNGAVKCRGWGWLLDTRQDASAVAAQSVVAGDGFTCILTTSGGVKCIGKNNYGQIGDGTTTDRNTLVGVIGLASDVVALTAGDSHTCALTTSGSVKCWGRNYFGQLGDGTTSYSLIPIEVKGLNDEVVSLTAGNDHTCAMSKGGVKCWGANDGGQLGDGSLINHSEPVDVMGLPNNVTALAAGFAHTCALTSQGEVLCWGDNKWGQLGDSNMTNCLAPVMVLGLDSRITSVVAGDRYTCALTVKGGVKCWGSNFYGQLGDGTTANRAAPADVIGLFGNVTALVAGDYHTCALMQTGEVKCWGMRGYGWDDGINMVEAAVPISRSIPVNALELSIQSSPTPTVISVNTPEPSTDMPMPLLANTATKTHSPTAYIGLALSLLILIGALFFFRWQSKVKNGK